MSEASSDSDESAGSSSQKPSKFVNKELYKQIKEQELQERKDKAMETMKYLVSVSKKYSTFFLNKLQKQQALKDKNDNNSESETKTDEPAEVKASSRMDLKYFEGGTLRDYQIEGLQWMKLLFMNGVNGILADEMGLGKTIQIIAFICFLLEQKVTGPYLIVAPLSTIPNWMSEWKKFAPRVPVVLFHGSRDERELKYSEISKKYVLDKIVTAPVVITSYQVPLMECNFLQQHKWQYLIIDEGHCLKNPLSKLGSVLRSLASLNRLLLTGTPLQNNLVELWSLLNFLMPQIFRDAHSFSTLLMKEDFEATDRIIEKEKATNIISNIHSVLAPFMLRRLKSEVLHEQIPKKEVLVYCPLSQLQRDLYSYILQGNINKLLGKEEVVKEEPISANRPKRLCIRNKKYESVDSDAEFSEEEIIPEPVKIEGISPDDTRAIICNIKMANPTMMLKKVVNHPYLVHFPLKPGTKNELLINEDLIRHSGKLMVLDALLPRLRDRNHKILLFSTLTSLLDMIEEYLIMRNYGYCRLDGSHNLALRDVNISAFNNDPDKLVFLISTRAGGLGLNLTSADTVILFDRDWNPQADIQAQDRCHRIGQTKPVVVYTFISKGTIDERILQTATNKRRLEKIVIEKGNFRGPGQKQVTTDIEELKKLLESVDHSEVAQSSDEIFSSEELEGLLDRTDLYDQMK